MLVGRSSWCLDAFHVDDDDLFVDPTNRDTTAEILTMANKVYANGREISCKAANGKSVAAFPDVCFTPPQTPGTPLGVPIPYPNTGMASDAANGSRSVKISGKEVMLKNKSYFKKSTGNEAGNAPKKGVLTGQIQGKVYFTSWSMDVKIEGLNVVRHLDLTTHNHGSMPGNTPPWAYTDSQAASPIDSCQSEAEAANEKCKGRKSRKRQCENKGCRDAKRCTLVTHNQGTRKGKNATVGCCPGEQPHHLVEAHCFYGPGQRGEPSALLVKSKKAYVDANAPCVCAKGPRHAKEHGQYHAFQGAMEKAHHEAKGCWNYAEARTTGLKAHTAVNPQCSEACTKAQLDAYHKKQCGLTDETKLRTDPVQRSAGKLNEAQQGVLKKALRGVNSSSGV